MIATTAAGSATIEAGRLRLQPMPLAEAARLINGEPTDALCAVEYPGDISLLAAGLVVTAAREQRDLGPFGWYQISYDGLVIGDCGFLDHPNVDGDIWVAWDVVASVRDTDLAAEALRGLIAWATRRREIRAVLADAAATDHARRRTLEDAGLRLLTREGDVAFYATEPPRSGLP